MIFKRLKDYPALFDKETLEVFGSEAEKVKHHQLSGHKRLKTKMLYQQTIGTFSSIHSHIH
jgi:hypothetical protein